MATYPQAQGFDLGSILQAAQLGRSLNPVNIQQEALNNQLALQLQQVQLQRAQQQLNDALNPNAAINRGLAADLVREAIVNGPRSGFYVTKPGVPVTQPLTPEEQSINEMRKTALEMGGVDLPQMTPKVIAEPVYGLGNEALPIARSLNARIKQAPFNLSQGEKRFDYNAETGKPELIAENAPKGVVDKLITVNKGEKIINAAGQLIFENPSDSPKPTIVPSGGVLLNEDGTEKFRNDKPAGGSTAGKFEQSLRKEFNADPIVKQFKEIRTQNQRMKDAIDESKKTGSLVGVDQALISTFNKMLDPESVVRESEYARTPQDIAFFNRIKGKIEKLKTGGAGLTSEERGALQRMSEKFYSATKRYHDETADYYSNIAQDNGIDPTRVIRSYADESINAPTASPGLDDFKKKHGLK